MAKERIAAVILAAGLGTRMRSAMPKALHPLAGRPMIAHLLETVAALKPERVVTVIGPGMKGLAATVAPHPTVVQKQRLGTGHAVAQAAKTLADFPGTVLVVYADTPLISRRTLASMLARRRGRDAPAVVVLGFRPADPAQYGRLVTGTHGLERIVEYKDASAEERAIGLVNSGVMAADAKTLFALLRRVRNANAKGEYYLTDVVGLARDDGMKCAVVEGEPGELLGINSRADLALAEAELQNRLRASAMEGGATLLDPASTFFSWDTKLGRDVTVGPNVMFGPGVTVAAGAEIRAFSHIEGARVGKGAIVGPFARLRPGADIGAGAHIGNFVEVKEARIDAGAKANHLAYIGDASVGAGANIGAGTITCNYDGFAKHRTEIGAGAFIGSDTALVAPVKVGAGAIVGAGSVITRDVPANALAVARGELVIKPDGAEPLRRKYRARKAKMKKGKR